MGNRFILVGDFDGQLQPIFDRWSDVAKSTDLSHSTLLHNMCNGLHVQLTEYRRGVDPELFANYFGLYPRLQDNIGQLVAEMRGKYPWDGAIVPDHCIVISHDTRVRVNDWLNKQKSSDQTWTLVKAETGVKRVGCKSEPQDMRLWPGIVLIGCTASNSPSGIVHSVTYEVVEVDAEKVVIQMTEEFRSGDVEKMRQDVEALQPFVAPLRELLFQGPKSLSQLSHARIEGLVPELHERFPRMSATQRWQQFFRLFDDTFELIGNVATLVEDNAEEPCAPSAQDVAKAAQKLTLTHSEASQNLRLTEALTYPSVQGRTLRDKHSLLMDANERSHFSSRHLVVGLSRATHGNYAHIAQERQSRAFVKTGEMTPPLADTPDRDAIITGPVYGPMTLAAHEQHEAMDALFEQEFGPDEDLLM